ncbi:3'-5' exonuclease [Tulasnella sp. 419]|nr:3'-5' exonuclease [Tulasnella sp. 419]
MAKSQSRSKTANFTAAPSSNWDALKQTMATQKKRRRSNFKTSKGSSANSTPAAHQTSTPIASTSSSIIANMMKTFRTPSNSRQSEKARGKEREIDETSSPSRPVVHTRVDVHDNTVESLREMVLGRLTYTPEQSSTGKYLAIDCEMVGVGPEGAESSLARVSIVNFYGAVIVDTFVKQREEVTDYRTAVSGVRHQDVYGPNARTFQEVQKLVSELLTLDRILVGHSVHHDLKVLMLSHPSSSIRDTQSNPDIRQKYKTTRISLKKAVKGELGIEIQSGEHNSVTDARASMALYRLYKDKWESLFRHRPSQGKSNHKDVDNSGAEVQLPLPQALSIGLTSSDRTDSTSPTSPPLLIPKKNKSEITKAAKQKAKANVKIDALKKSHKTKISSGLSVVVKNKNGIKEIRSGTKGSKREARREREVREKSGGQR